MLRNYFKTALRNLRKNKVYSFINIFGLTIGLASFILIALYIFDELTADRFHKQVNNIYRVVEHKTSTEGKETKVASVAYNVSAQGKKSLPEVADATRLTVLGRANISNEENTNVFYESYYLADASFFKIFDFEVLEGEKTTALQAPNSVVLTEETAEKIFGTTSVLGKTIRTDRDSTPFKITAVLKNIPTNSHLQFNLVFSEASLDDPQTVTFLNSDWTSNNFTSYFLFRDDANVPIATAKINDLVAQHQSLESKTKSSFLLQTLKNIHFYSEGIEGEFSSGNIFYIYVFGILGLFVLIIACINYINLTTARFSNRAKEIAVRKVAGAFRKNLVKQFLSEAFVVTLISFLLALGVVKLMLPAFNVFVEKQLSLGVNTDVRIWIGLAAIIVIVTLLSGVYPAFFQSNHNPIKLLKTRLIPGKNTLSLRKALVIFQFSLSIIMIVSTIIVYLQLKYINTKDMGFNKEQLVVIDINSGAVRKSAETIKQEYSKLSAVKEVTVSSRVPGEWKALPKVKVAGSGSQQKDMYFIGADDGFLPTYSITLLKGRNFMASPIDSASVILNETAAIELGIKEPSEQIIEIPSLDFNGSVRQLDEPFKARVIGIAKDFNFKSLREEIAPMVIGYQKNPLHSIDYFTAKVSAGDMTATLKQLESVLVKIDPRHLFEYNFLDKQWDKFYHEDQKRQTIFIAVALITILIACLGLFGLATYTAEQRTKEIGIRKVLGATVSSIVGMLSKDFLILVLIATFIAIPVSWFAMNSWLQDFAYRVDISWWVFAVAGMAALIIAFITISFQAIKAALSNPVKSLRTE